MISQRVAQIEPSLTLEITARANKMKASGIDVVVFAAGEPDMPTPAYICDGAKKAINEGKTKYTASSGILQLRTAICDKLKNDNELFYIPDQIVISNGAKQSLFNVIQALVNNGDEVIIPAPYWLTYPELVKLAGGVPVYAFTEENNNFKLTAKQLESVITKNTKAVIINSPNNPTGAVYSKDELENIAKVAKDAGIWIISDEIYEKLVYDGKKHFSIAALSKYEKTVVINGFSKAYAMTGWRIGYSASSSLLAKAMDSFQSHTTSNINTPSQYAALEALTNKSGDNILDGMIKTFDERRKYMISRLKRMQNITFTVPEGAFYVLINISKLGKKAVEVASELLEKANIAAIPGESFGAPNHIRLSYALSMTDIEKGLDRLEKYLQEKKND